ncbi:MAG: Mur ligase [Proteobacteria bacterium]|nr:Mur ligase [Pseudomonadota bacterium]MBS0574798.1 Mur ligase [Pseudomonadota bacterium]
MAATSAEMQAALVLPLPDDPALVLDGCRRLMGPNLFGRETGAVGDALTPGADHAAVLARWRDRVRALLDGMGWTGAEIRARLFDGGASLFLAAPADQLFTAAYVVEAGFHLAASELLGLPCPRVACLASDLRELAAREADPRLRRLIDGAAARGVDRLLDDDALTLGHGEGGMTWAAADLPDDPGWDAIHDIPLALVTGTNGKTTTTRLIAAMGQAAGLTAGLSSTEAVRVGDDILDRGDYSGPAGARLLLRDRRLQVGVLEVARGGILRRGVPVTRARAAVVTNVAADHLGQYGITTVPELAEVKLAVRHGLADGGLLVLNADDAPLVAAVGAAGQGGVAWFSLSPDAPLIAAARAAGRPCGWLEAGALVLSDGAEPVRLIAAAEVPLTLGGAARYNIENALGAALAARALGLPDPAIRAALAAFRSDPADNPGRANEFTVKGARVFVDFAHNPHSIAAVTSALAALPARRRFILLSHAGDRSDEDIRALTRGAFALRPDVVVAAENPKYLRGRAPGEVSGLIRAESLDCAAGEVLMAASPLDGAAQIVARLAPGDLALLLVHDEREAILALLKEAGA